MIQTDHLSQSGAAERMSDVNCQLRVTGSVFGGNRPRRVMDLGRGRVAVSS